MWKGKVYQNVIIQKKCKIISFIQGTCIHETNNDEIKVGKDRRVIREAAPVETISTKRKDIINSP